MAVKTGTISKGLKYSLATGNWGAQGTAGVKAGVSQVLNRLTYASTLSHLRRVNSPIGREGKLAKPRQLHNTLWGMMCPAETPEGQVSGRARGCFGWGRGGGCVLLGGVAGCAVGFEPLSSSKPKTHTHTNETKQPKHPKPNQKAVGLVKNLALMAYITVGSPSGPVLEFLEEWTTERLDEVAPPAIGAATKVFVNGAWVGVHREPQQLVATLRALRRQLDINTEVGLVHDYGLQELRLFTDAGRVARPLFIVDNGALRIRRGHVRKVLRRCVFLAVFVGSFGGEWKGLFFASACLLEPPLCTHPKTPRALAPAPPPHPLHHINQPPYLQNRSETEPGVDERGEPCEVEWGWGRLVAAGLVEYVDAEEEEAAMIAMATRDVVLSRCAYARVMECCMLVCVCRARFF
jgi:DNA-directed RNA polymerase beta subunit